MSQVTYRKVNDDDFTEDGKGKSELKFYESDDGATPKDPNTTVTEPTKENKEKYVVKVEAAAGGPPPDESSASASAAAGGPPPDESSAAAGGPPPDGGKPKDKIDIAVKAMKSVLESQDIRLNEDDKKVVLQKICEVAQGGGRRRSKRRQPKRSAKKSKKGGRSRKNHRKQSRRRKH